MSLRLKWDVLDTFFARGWGYAILVAFLMAMLSIGFGGGPYRSTIQRILRAYDDLGGREPTKAEATLLNSLVTRYTRLSRLEVVWMVVAVGAMAAARWL